MAKSTTTKNYKLLTAKFDKRNEKNEEVRYKKGDIVPLTELEYEAFGDKFEFVDQTTTESAPSVKVEGTFQAPKTPVKPSPGTQSSPGK